ncbi:MAG: ATP synthase subunit I [Polaromonas sp.]
MRKINDSAANDAWSETKDDEVIKSLNRQEAQALRERNPALSPWVVLAGQAGGGVVVALAAWLLSGKVSVGWSALYGAMAVVIPGALFARGLMSRVSTINPAAAVTGFFLWEMVKIGLVLAMLFAAPRLVKDLSWPAMLVGLVVTMKVVWLVLWLEAKVRRKSKMINVG